MSSTTGKLAAEFSKPSQFGLLAGAALWGLPLLLVAVMAEHGAADRASAWAEAHAQQLGRALLLPGGGFALLGLYDLVGRSGRPSTPLPHLIARALHYGGLGLLGLFLYAASHGRLAVLFEQPVAAMAGAASLFMGGLASLSLFRATPVAAVEDYPAYQRQVAELQDTYDFVLGTEFPDDERGAEQGRRAWKLLPAAALWTNLYVFGGIGSGKTSAFAYPLLHQALLKFQQDDARRPSIFLLDLKGDNAAQVYEFARRAGRADDFFVIRPGNELKTAFGPLPSRHFLKWNPVGGSAAYDVRAAMLYDAFEATSHGSSPQYFKDVQSEFLSATLALFDAVQEPGTVTLAELYKFGLNDDYRGALLEAATSATSPLARIATEYFDGKFNKLEPKDRTALISGLSAKLAKFSSRSLLDTFCPGDDETGLLESFHDVLTNRSGIVVFSVPEALYSQELARLLGVAALRAFQTAMLQRTDTEFGANGGNTERLVLNVVDECWAYMNRGVASFTAVSRQAKTCSLYLSQSLDQIAPDYRDTVLGNFRSKVLLGVNDPLTLRTFSDLFGTVEEEATTEGISQSLQGASTGLGGTVSGRSKGLSASISRTVREVPRFGTTALQHQPAGFGVAHIFDGGRQLPAVTIQTTPWYRLPYFLFHPLGHRSFKCREEGPPHRYVRVGSSYTCDTCGAVLVGQDADDYRSYVQEFPDVVGGER